LATEIAEFSQQEAINMNSAIRSLSTTITGIAVASEETFPFVTIPHFDLHGLANNNISVLEQITFAPLVKREQRVEWEFFSRKNQGWMHDGTPRGLNEDDHIQTIPAKIHSFQNVTNETAEYGTWAYAPVWQQAPISEESSMINFNLLSHPVFKAGVLPVVKDTPGPLFTEPLDVGFLTGHSDERDVFHLHPHSLIVDPIYSTLEMRSDIGFVGLLVGIVSWDTYFSNILHDNPDESDPAIIVVMHSSCGASMTYRIEGPLADYLGPTDEHEGRYDGLEKRVPFFSMLNRDHRDSCNYELRIFPTTTMENYYTSSNPILYAIVTFLIFAAMAVSFMAFDYSVARRQDDVLAKATRTNAIVSSLFPSNVRDRILQDADEQLQRELLVGKKARKSPLSSAVGETGNKSAPNSFNSKPIADLFPSATIMVRFHTPFLLSVDSMFLRLSFRHAVC
jgi:hypothetical protein